MGKLKKLFALVLTLGLAASFAAACGKKGGDSDSSSQQSSSVVSEEVSSEVSSEEENSTQESSESLTESSAVESESEEESSGTESSEDVHTCITEGEWNTNETEHWLECDCGKIVQCGTHEGTAADCDSQPVCNICEVPYGTPPGHTYGEMSDGEAGKAYYCTCGAYITNEDLVDFVVEVESGKDPVVLQLSDTQSWNWGDSPEIQCYRYISEVVEKTNPDLIILTGDIVYGRFDPKGALFTSLITFMETLDIPWAPVFGNHDNESLMGVDWQCQQLETAENCLFKQGDVTGNGNYTVGIEQDGELLRVFYMMDSNGCNKPMCDDQGVQTAPKPGTNVVQTSRGFGADQIAWYTDSINAIHAVDADVKISFAYHIQQAIFETAFEKYDEYDGLAVDTSSSTLANPLNLDTLEGADDTDFGYLGRQINLPWDMDNKIFNEMKALGCDSIFVGHEHCNSASIVYDGVRFQYGQKSSTYDRHNVLTADGTIVNNKEGTGTPLVGGTVIPISSEDGTIGTGYICYYGDPFAEEEPTGPWGSVIQDCVLLSETTLDTATDAPTGFEKVYAVNGTLKKNGQKSTLDLSGYNEVRFAFKSEKYFLFDGWTIYLQEAFTDWVMVKLQNKGNGNWTVIVNGNVYDGKSISNPYTFTYTGNTVQELLAKWENGKNIYVTELRADAAAEPQNWGEKVADSAFANTTSNETDAPSGYEIVSEKSGFAKGDFANVDITGYNEIRFQVNASSWILLDGWSVYYDVRDKWVSWTLTNVGENEWTLRIDAKTHSGANTTAYYEETLSGSTLQELFANYYNDGTITVMCTEVRGIKTPVDGEEL